MAGRADLQDDFLSCSICYEVFKEPKTLNCMHRFCEQCLHKYIIVQPPEVTRRGGFLCPVCREFSKSPNARSPPSKWASLFKTDFHLSSLITFVKSRETLSLVHPCQDHANKECDLYCVDCARQICHLCAGISHRTCNSVISLEEAATDRRATVELQLKEMKEKYKTAMEFENTRENLLDQLEREKTAVEAAIKNRGQEMRCLVQTEENKLLQKLNKEYAPVYDQATSKVITFEGNLSKFKSELQQISSKLESLSDFDLTTKTDILEPLSQLNSQINFDEYTHFLKQLSEVNITFHRRELTSLTLGEVKIQRQKNDSQPLPSDVCAERVTSPGRNRTRSHSVLAITHQKSLLPSNSAPMLATSGQLQRPPAQSLSQGEVPGIPPKPRQTKSDSRSSDQDQTRNCVKTAESTVSGDTPEFNVSPTSGLSNRRQGLMLFRSINTQFKDDDFQPKLRDLIVAGSVVLVTDWANQSVKAFYARHERNKLTVGSKPWAITQLSETLAAVSLPLTRQICVIKTRPTLMVQNSFMSEKSYSGLASLNSSMLVASGGSHPPSVDIINLYGEVLRTFDTDTSGSPMFVYPAYVSVTPSSTILVSDRKLGCVTCLSHKGELKFRFPETGTPRVLQEPSGVTACPSGHIFVVETRGLLSLSWDGHLEQTLVKPQDQLVEDPRGIALDKEGLLYLSSHDQEVRVFKFS